jgi:hypothetical protein
MTITFALADANGGTDLLAVHDRLPSGLPPADNETRWRMSLAKLAALVGTSQNGRSWRIIRSGRLPSGAT